MLFPKLLKISPFVILTLLNLYSLTAHAAKEGGVSGGGGDASEVRVNDIRADILKWIGEGGAETLKLPSGITRESYRAGMEKFLAPHAVGVGFVSTTQETWTPNPEGKVNVNGLAKTCRGFVSSNDGLPHILCNTERFAATSESQQYQLIHHEFAGLAGLEQNIGASSDYQLSKQLTDFLVAQTVLRLAVKRNVSPTPYIPLGASETDKAFFGLQGSYTKIGEAWNCPLALEISAYGGGKWDKALLNVRQNPAQPLFDEGEFNQETYESSYEWKPFYSGYSKHKIATYLNPKNGYVVHENIEFISKFPSVIRWFESSVWIRESLFLKKNSNGILHVVKKLDTKGTDGADLEPGITKGTDAADLGPAINFNCLYRAQ
ncbi:hypothetical protein WDW86_17560 [Bdellovibrionota bacterium FG-2]